MSDGVLIVDKPSGMTSHDVVVAARRALRIKKIGHTGTLDPLATGVLALVIGRATRLSGYLTGGDKRYRATVRLGVTTDTLDREGQVQAERPVPALDQAALRALLAGFEGPGTQLPPMYSAKKIGGKRLYELARQGQEVEREPKPIVIHQIALERLEPPDLELSVHCSAGTYLRVLAADLGARLGCGACLQALSRTAVGPFTLAQAHPLAELLEAGPRGRDWIIPLERALPHLPRLDLPEILARRVHNGEALKVKDIARLPLPEGLVVGQAVTLFVAGQLVAVGRLKPAAIALHKAPGHLPAVQPERVLGPAEGDG